MPKIQLPAKIYPILTTTARIIVLVGGRGSGKSESTGRVLVMKAQTESADVLCGREYQNSIEDSVHKLIKTLIVKTKAPGFSVTDKKIDCSSGGGFRFKGFARNSEAVKSAQDFKYSWVEEAQSLSQQSIDDLLPTIRATGSKLLFTANPQSSGDPFSKRFIVPYHAELLSQGFYQDEMHLIILVNWRDNPWFPKELELQRQWDFVHLSRAKYDHIWEGAFNDSVEDALIQAEWFDACVDAHVKLGIEPRGMLMAAHDPSDEGPDSKGYAMRHGSVVMRVEERDTGNINEGCDWALGMALEDNVDTFTWDCDGMGVGLSRQVSLALDGKAIRVSMFRGSNAVDYPERIFDARDGKPIADRKTNKEALKNKRAQYYGELRRRVMLTYDAVVKGIYADPDDILSFSSTIPLLQKLRSELCRMPIKPNANGMFELYTKEVMKKRFKIDSPNLGDSVMMLMRQPQRLISSSMGMPAPIKVMGKRKN